MLGDFMYSNPTRLYFGEHAMDNLKTELANYGPKVQLVYGGGSIKKNGIYDQVTKILQECGKTVFEDGGVMPNPTTEKLYEGCRIARDNGVDLILAVGGGSVCDYSKMVCWICLYFSPPFQSTRTARYSSHRRSGCHRPATPQCSSQCIRDRRCRCRSACSVCIFRRSSFHLQSGLFLVFPVLL